MTEIRDKDGNLLLLLPKERFPLKITDENTTTSWRIFAKFVTVVSADGERETLQSVNTGK